MSLRALPPKILLLVADYITDPIDLHALRRTARRFKYILAPRFRRVFPPNFQLTIAYWDLNLSPWGEATATELNTIDLRPVIRCEDFGRRCHDAMIHHAASRQHIRHLRAVLRRPFPPSPSGCRNIRRVWVGYQNALWSAAQRGWIEGLRELWRHRPVGWVMDRDTAREARDVFYGTGNGLNYKEDDGLNVDQNYCGDYSTVGPGQRTLVGK